VDASPLPLPLTGPLLVASDLHLSPQDPEGVARFVRFAAGPARAAGTVILAGDLFEVWTHPSQAGEPGLRPVFDAIRGLIAAGVRVGFIEGNRDFEASPALRAVGVEILDDVVVVEGGAAPGGLPLRVVITHGDRLCVRDVRYQAFRRFARGETVRHLLRCAPAVIAGSGGRAARAGSRMETARKTYGDMGLDAVAVAGLLRSSDADVLVCGHVHWGRCHRIDVDGRTRDVIVLGAWDSGDASYARIAAGRAEFVRFE
jgi:UDP-2,3-diacylglucosamine hydrolase